jgi:flagellar biosynthesis protein
MRQRRPEAIALAYGKNDAPVVTAKGQDELAERIIAIAKEQGIYIAQDPQLLAMLSRLDLEEQIPPQLYAAVAVILSWAYWLKGMTPGDEKVVAADPPPT